MLRHAILGLLLATLLLTPQTAAGTVTGTSSTGDIDTWGVMNAVPCEPDTDAIAVPQISIKGPDLGSALQDALDPVDHCFGPCPRDIIYRAVTLRLLDSNPGDHVAITVVGDPPAAGRIAQDALNRDPSAYPTAVATHDDPEAHVWIQLGGCNRTTTVVVTGIVVEGEVAYELTF